MFGDVRDTLKNIFCVVCVILIVRTEVLSEPNNLYSTLLLKYY